MAGVKGSRTFPLVIGAGLETTLNVGGEFFYVLSCDQTSFLMAMDNSGLDFAKLRTYKRVEDGAQYNSLRISNPNAAPLTLQIVAGFGQYGDDEVEIGGAVTVSSLPDVTLSMAGAFSATAAVVGIAAAVLVAQNLTRKSLVIQNLGTSDIFIGGAGVTVANGLRIKGNGGEFVVDKSTAAIYAISAAAGQDVRLFEEG